MSHNLTTCFASHHVIPAGVGCRIAPIIQVRPDTWTLAGSFMTARFQPGGSARIERTLSNFRAVLSFLGRTLRDDNATELETPNILFQRFVMQCAPQLYEKLVLAEDSMALTEPADELWAEISHCWDYLWLAAHEQRGLPPARAGGMLDFAVLQEDAYQSLIAASSKEMSLGVENLTPRRFFDEALRLAEQQANAPELRARHRRRREVMLRYLWPALSTGHGGVAALAPDPAIQHRLTATYVARELTADGLFEHVSPWLEGQYIVMALDLLGIQPRPLVHTLADHTLGMRYARFLQDCHQTGATAVQTDLRH